MAYQSLISVKSSLKTVTATNETSATDDSRPQESLIAFESDFEETLTKMLQMMRSKLDGPQVCRIPLSNMTFVTVSCRFFPSLALMMKIC
jgi:hypothetical protein